MPLRFTVWVLPAALLLLSVTVSVPAREPPAVGVKVTLMVQEPLAATLLPQLLVCAKLVLAVMLADGEGGVTGVGERDGLRAAGGVDRQSRKRECRRAKRRPPAPFPCPSG